MWTAWKAAGAELVEALAAMDSEPVAWLAIYHGEVYDEAIGITRSVVEAQADHFGWELALTEIIPLYRHAQPAPVVMDDRKLRALLVLRMLDEYPEQLVPVNRKSALIRELRGAVSAAAPQEVK